MISPKKQQTLHAFKARGILLGLFGLWLILLWEGDQQKENKNPSPSPWGSYLQGAQGLPAKVPEGSEGFK